MEIKFKGIGENKMGMSYCTKSMIDRIFYCFGDRVCWLNDTTDMFELKEVNKNERRRIDK